MRKLSFLTRAAAGCLAAALFCLPAAAEAALTLDKTSVGRFGAGHRILPATANQDLLAWNILNSGRDVETRVYDAEGKTVSLGRAGFAPAGGEGGAKIQNEIRDIHWTQLVSRYRRGGQMLDIRESLLTPALWLRTTADRLALFQAEPKPAPQDTVPVVEALALPLARGGVRLAPLAATTPYARARDGRLSRPYLLALVRRGAYRVPVLCLLTRNPEEITRLASGGLVVRWRGAKTGQELGLLPLDGCRPSPVARTEGWLRSLPADVVRRADALAGHFLRLPTGVAESYAITAGGVNITNKVTFDDRRRDEWGWLASKSSGGYAVAPPALENARRYGYPVRYDRAVADLDYPTFLGPLCVVPAARTLTYTLPRPRLYETLASPFADPATEAILPEPVTRTIREYSGYVTRTYARKNDWMYDKSAVGEGRILGSEYPCLRMMDAPARKAFTAWADRAAKVRLYNWAECYGYGEEKTNGRRFYLDNYRFGSDYMDAGWFGYNVIAMWARSHYGGHWDEARANWPRIRELFYGWNWVYTDYAAMYSPLYVDGMNGGSAKGYTDNMSMLPALYAWARMADRLGDRETLGDALYMLARDRVARYNRMAIHDYTRRCGFKTDVYWFTSDMGNGPNISPTGRYIPPDSAPWRQGDIVNYGNMATGLWFLTGSFLEPVTAETIDLMREGGMKKRAAETVALIDRRFPRWWASPGAAEMANYQIYLRGALLREDPTWLRYYFDYQEGFQSGVWTAAPWHSDAYAGIVLSRFHPLPGGAPQIRDGAAWRAARGEVEAHLLEGKDGKRRLSLWNTTTARITIRLPRGGAGRTQFSLAPGANLFAFDAARDRSPARPVSAPSAIVAVTGEPATVPITLTNDGAAPKRYRVTAPGLFAGGTASREVVVPPGGKTTVTGTYTAPATAGDRPDLRVTVTEANGRPTEHRVGVLLLPALVALLDMPGEKLMRPPHLAAAEIVAWNRRRTPATLQLASTVDGKQIMDKTLTVAPGRGMSWNIPLPAENLAAGRYTLATALTGEGIETSRRSRDIVLLNAPGQKRDSDWIVLYGFERSTEEWFLPDWPDANKDGAGKVATVARSEALASEGKASLQTTLNVAAGKQSRAFLSVRPNFDWRPFGRARIDIYLPPDAPAGLTAGFYMMGDGWRWRESVRRVPLTPGKWTPVEVALDGPAAAADWKQTAEDIRSCLKNVLDIGVNIQNGAPNFAPYRGPVHLDDLRAELRP